MARESWAKDVKNRNKKTDNNPAAHQAKVKLRQVILEEIGPQRAHVFDAFAGEGVMYRSVWQKAASCVGCDLKLYWDDRLAFVCDNVRVLRAVPLAQFNVFDFDAYGSPWEQVLIVADNRKLAPGERIAFALTEGSGMGIKLGNFPKALKALAGLRGRANGAHRFHDDVIRRAIQGLASRMDASIKRIVQARGKTGARMFYLAVILEGNPDT